MHRCFWPLVAFILFSSLSFAQDCEKPCGSQLLRVEVSSNLLKNGGAESLLPALKKVSESPTLRSALERSFPIKPLGFPQSQEVCLREQAEGDPAFKDIECTSSGLCGNTELNPEVREKICFKLPCPIVEGTLNTGKCSEKKEIYPTEISFPTPVTIQKIALTPTKSEFKDDQAKLCFNINELDIMMSTSLTLDTSKTQLPDKSINITNINPVLDGPRELCITAQVNLGTPNPISNLKLVALGDSPFISDDMIRTAAKKLQIQGLSGYPENDLKAIQSELVPVLFQPMRASIEQALQLSLGKTFETQLQSVIQPLTPVNGKSASKVVDSTSLMSELGIANIQVQDQLAKTECAYLANTGRPIPPKHACIGLMDFGEPITTEWKNKNPSSEFFFLASEIKGKKVTSESIKQRLMALKELMREEKINPIFINADDTPEEIERSMQFHREGIERRIKDELEPLVDGISNNQMETQVLNFIQIQNQLSRQSNTIGLSLPEICNEKPSPHVGKKIKNCPIQVYADLNEFNVVLEKMWESGRMCMDGGGEYKPELDASGKQAYTAKGKVLAKGGCFMEMSGMGCYLKSAPQIKYDAKTKKYKVALKLQHCFYPGVILGIGKFGGDFNIDFAFAPKACNNGDFCMENPDVKWNIVPGTERFSMKDGSFLKGIITSKINDAVKGAMKNQIRLPLASGVGPMANVPLQAEGRVDSGPGYFGACLEIQKGASGQ